MNFRKEEMNTILQWRPVQVFPAKFVTFPSGPLDSFGSVVGSVSYLQHTHRLTHTHKHTRTNVFTHTNTHLVSLTRATFQSVKKNTSFAYTQHFIKASESPLLLLFPLAQGNTHPQEINSKAQTPAVSQHAGTLTHTHDACETVSYLHPCAATRIWSSQRDLPPLQGFVASRFTHSVWIRAALWNFQDKLHEYKKEICCQSVVEAQSPHKKKSNSSDCPTLMQGRSSLILKIWLWHLFTIFHY